jgi:hypothetical protein
MARRIDTKYLITEIPNDLSNEDLMVLLVQNFQIIKHNLEKIEQLEARVAALEASNGGTP